MAPYRSLYVAANVPRRMRPAPRLVRSVAAPEPLVRPRNVALGVASGCLLACASVSPLGVMVALYAALGAAVYRIAA